MRKHFSLFCICILAAALALAFPLPARPVAPNDNRPKVRAITAFIALDRTRYQTQIAETLAALKKIKAAYEKAGFEVQTLRITTQPFPEYTRNLSDEQALAFFKKYDALAEKDGFDAAIGPTIDSATGPRSARSRDDAHEALLLAKIIASTKILEGSVVIADDNGIHWHAIPSAAA